jgi:hypothetical protein
MFAICHGVALQCFCVPEGDQSSWDRPSMQRLKRSDFYLEKGLVHVAPMKRSAVVWKTIRPMTHMFLKRIREGGVTACRRRSAGMIGEAKS